MPDPPANDEHACRECALRLLERRAHSVEELRRKLRARRFSNVAIETILADLQRTRLLADLEFAKAFCEERGTGPKARGTRRLEHELRRRGVSLETIREALGDTGGALDSQREFGPALQAGRRKWQSVRRRDDVDNARAKVYRFLANRGFSADTCHRVLDRLGELENEA